MSLQSAANDLVGVERHCRDGLGRRRHRKGCSVAHLDRAILAVARSDAVGGFLMLEILLLHGIVDGELEAALENTGETGEASTVEQLDSTLSIDAPEGGGSGQVRVGSISVGRHHASLDDPNGIGHDLAHEAGDSRREEEVVRLELSLSLRLASGRAMFWVDDREGQLFGHALEAKEEAPASRAANDIGGDTAVKAGQVALRIVDVLNNFEAGERFGRRTRLDRVD